MKIEINAGLDCDLKWEKERKRAQEAEQKITWVLDLGLDGPYFPIDDPLSFQGLLLGLAQFTETFYPEFAENTEKIILYKGSWDFSSHFRWNEKQEENFQLWQEERPLVSPREKKRLFCADAFAYYFQMLSHKLPLEAPLALEFTDMPKEPSVAAELVISKERFEYFELITNREATSSRAVLFPCLEKSTQNVLDHIETLFQKIPSPYRVIHESHLTEEWEGVDHLIVLREALSELGFRKLQGFNAAGGTVVTEGEFLGLPLEIGFKEFLDLQK